MIIKQVSNHLARLVSVSLASLLLTTTAHAVPVLQLDIEGGTYDPAAEDIVAPDATFTLLALGTPKGNVNDVELKTVDYYILSVALTPKDLVAMNGNYGSFDYCLADCANASNWKTVLVTADMTYGNPPIEAALADQDHDGGDLGPHGIFDTYFVELAVTFVDADKCVENNSAEADTTTCVEGIEGKTYFDAIEFDATKLNGEYGLHFDLYNTKMTNKKVLTDVDSGDFAPFSHDARYGCCGVPVPEPGTIGLLGIGLLGLGFARRRKSAV